MKKAIILGILVFGLVLGLGNVGFTGLQEAKRIIKVSGAEDFIVEDVITENNAKQRKLVDDFGALVFAMFFDLYKKQIPSIIGMPLEQEVYLARGITSKKMAVVFNDWGIGIEPIKSGIVCFYYLNDLEEIIQKRAPGFLMYYGPSCQNCINLLVMLPEAKEIAQEFIDAIKEKIREK